MPYPVITSRRIPYDVDGTVVGYRNGQQNLGVSVWSLDLSKLNTDSFQTVYADWRIVTHSFWIFFPEKVEIEQIFVHLKGPTSFSCKASNDTSNGIDGTWESPIYPNGTPSSISGLDAFRRYIKPISFSEPKKVLYCAVGIGDNKNTAIFSGLHLFGRKASGETPNDILICDINGNELTALMEWGDRPEGTTLIKSFKVKNASTTKIANNVNLQLNHADFLMSLDQANWVATIDIASIPANSLSAEIFIKNALGPPLLTLGPKAARVIVTVGSFT